MFIYALSERESEWECMCVCVCVCVCVCNTVKIWENNTDAWHLLQISIYTIAKAELLFV
jgi:hypothetical protein